MTRTTNLKGALGLGLLTLSLMSCGGGAPGTPDTGGGTPGGQSGSAVVGPGGGTLTSADGRVRVTIPAGALGKDTTLSVQPITATAPHARLAYRLSPTDVTLAKPAELSLNYGTAGLAAETPSVGSVLAVRDGNGTWQANLGTVQDRAAHTLKMNLRGFGDFAWAEAIRLSPESATVETGGSVGLAVNLCVDDTAYDPNTPLDLMLAPLVDTCRPSRLGPLANGWAVNGHPGGTFEIGTVKKIDGTEARGQYLAPLSVPTPNPVAVTVNWGKGASAVTLVSTITVRDDEQPPCTQENAPDRWAGTTTATMLVNGLHETMKAKVGFVRDPLDPAQPDLCTYHVENGTVTWSLSDTVGGCTYSAGPVTLPIAPEDGQLTLDTGTSPITYSGSGGTSGQATVSVTCPDRSLSYSTVVGIGGWLTIPADRTWNVSADGRSLAGEYSLGENRWTWAFSHEK
ncbi:hypothetical protein DAERI_070025 [Deinococcus aerius]|uniref:ZU5 domain-containing protein n=1 Tax=Deinococcus aerius TaxID=200253 RepID=A0A2I9DTP8_9DEIO|nr:hypothetical protein [Deinococcus aerius]GBF06027.1 hypothetical protein DAERI_070025 [Deinococcus aerius]